VWKKKTESLSPDRSGPLTFFGSLAGESPPPRVYLPWVFKRPPPTGATYARFGDARDVICSTRSSPESNFSNVRWDIVLRLLCVRSVIFVLFTYIPSFQARQPFIQFTELVSIPCATSFSPWNTRAFHRPDTNPHHPSGFLLWITHASSRQLSIALRMLGVKSAIAADKFPARHLPKVSLRAYSLIAPSRP